MDVPPGDIAGAPGLSLGFSLVSRIYEANKNVKVYRSRCNHVAAQCRELLVTLEDSLKGLEGERARIIGDEMEGLLRRVERKAIEWSTYSYLKSFLLQGDIQAGLLELDRSIDTIGKKFQIQASMDTARFQRELREAQKRDEIQHRELLVRIVQDVEAIKRLVNLESNPGPAVERVMHSLQEELQEPDLQPEQEATFKNGLYILHKSAYKLLSLTDLTGQIEADTKHRVAAGTHNDIYTGQWLNREKVALRLPRSLAENPKVQKRFERDLTVWRKLSHPNVLPLYGIYYEGKDVYSVSPWMENGTILNYFNRYPTANRLDIIHQVATGLQYLHSAGIIHGDLRAANVLVDKDQIAYLSDFGMSKVLEDVGHDSTTSPGHNPRWCAPELLEKNGTTSRMTDIWSFAMVCLEIMTEQPPFQEIKNPMHVNQLLMAGKHPPRPELNSRISDNLWQMLEKCWQQKPQSRPKISDIVLQIEQLRRSRSLTVPPPKAPNRITSFISRVRRSSASLINSSRSSEPWELIPPALPLSEEPGHIGPSRSSLITRSPSEAPRLEFHVEVNEEDKQSPEDCVEPSVLGRQEPFLSPNTSPGHPSISLPSPHFPRSVQTSDSSSQYSASTRAAVTDTNVIICPSRDGPVVSGTLEGLVTRLINGQTPRQDEEFRDVLLFSTVDFVPAEEFFSVIERHFNESISTSCSQDRVRKQSNILAIVLYWVKTPHLMLDYELIWQMRRFCEYARSLLNSKSLRRRVGEILDALNEDIRSASLRTPLQGPPLTRSEMRPTDLAVGLTLMENDKFRQIRPSDYLLYFSQERPGQPNAVELALEVNLKIVKWAQKSMLLPDDVLQRIEAMTFFLNTADVCLSIGNFSSAVAIATAFSSKPIDDLNYSKEQLEPPLKVILRTLRSFIGKDHQHYHELLGKQLPLESNHCRCIPWLAVHLSDLSELLNCHPITCEEEGRTLINFDRYIRFWGYLQKHSLSPLSGSGYTDLEKYRHSGQLAYVDSKLNNIKLDDLEFDDELEKRARVVKAADLRDRDRRVVEVNRLGIRHSGKK